MKCPVDSGAELMPQVLCDEGGHLASHAPKIEDEGKAWACQPCAMHRRDVQGNCTMSIGTSFGGLSGHRSGHRSQIMAAPALRLYTG